MEANLLETKHKQNNIDNTDIPRKPQCREKPANIESSIQLQEKTFLMNPYP